MRKKQKVGTATVARTSGTMRVHIHKDVAEALQFDPGKLKATVLGPKKLLLEAL